MAKRALVDPNLDDQWTVTKANKMMFVMMVAHFVFPSVEMITCLFQQMLVVLTLQMGAKKGHFLAVLRNYASRNESSVLAFLFLFSETWSAQRLISKLFSNVFTLISSQNVTEAYS